MKINRRINERSIKRIVEDQLMGDSYNNFTAKLGLSTENLSSQGRHTYGNMISRQRALLEIIYRTSWIAGQVVDTIAEDMTKEGIEMFSELSPDHIQQMQSKMSELEIMPKMCENIKWSRLYGGSIAVLLIEGANYETPLNINRVGKGQFKGLAVFDRWQIEPSLMDLITEVGPMMGMPKYYTVMPSMETLSGEKIHHSRVIRLDGIRMPYFQRRIDNFWGMSIVERLYDRLLAFDSATTGAAQMLYKAYLRVVQIEGLRTALGMGGSAEQAVIKQFQYIRLMQSQEGITLLDGKDQFSTHQYAFAGVSDVLIQFGQQISGATNIPLVRLFGQSPAGFSTGESDLRNYYDHISKLQENHLRSSVGKILEILSMSCLGKPLPDDFDFEFSSLWEMSDTEKAQVASTDANTLNTLFQSGIITKKIAMKELLQQSRLTGRFTNITDEDIENAIEEPPEHQGMGQKQEPPVKAGKQELDLSELEAELKKLDQPEPEQDDVEVSIESLEKELQLLGGQTLEQLEKELQAITIGEKTFSELEAELKELGLSDNSIEMLEKQLAEIKLPAPLKKMPVTDRGQSFENAVRQSFGITIDKKEEKWITIQGKEASRKVKLDENGNIIGGDLPKAAQGKKLNQLEKVYKKENKKADKKPNKKEKINQLKASLKKTNKSEPGVKRSKSTANFIYGKRDENGKLKFAGGKALPEHLKGKAMAPGYTAWLVNPDPKGKLWALGFNDEKGTKCWLYSDDHNSKKGHKKDFMVRDLDKNIKVIHNQIDEGIKAKDSNQRDISLIAKTLVVTGARIGSSKDPLGVNGRTYGISTLEARHIVKEGDKVLLKFIGKDSKENIYEVEDKKTAKELLKVKQGKKPTEPLFDSKYTHILDYVKQLDGGDFTPKNFRTKIGTDLAIQTIKKMEAPTNEKEYKKMVKEVATIVATRLNNGVGVALKDYIVPSVWADWKIKAGVE